jgi:hypothetical protein
MSYHAIHGFIDDLFGGLSIVGGAQQVKDNVQAQVKAAEDAVKETAVKQIKSEIQSKVTPKAEAAAKAGAKEAIYKVAIVGGLGVALWLALR